MKFGQNFLSFYNNSSYDECLYFIWYHIYKIVRAYIRPFVLYRVYLHIFILFMLFLLFTRRFFPVLAKSLTSGPSGFLKLAKEGYWASFGEKEKYLGLSSSFKGTAVGFASSKAGVIRGASWKSSTLISTRSTKEYWTRRQKYHLDECPAPPQCECGMF